ncbi:MAG: DUF447 domain-containing protein [Candidatus Methanospirareceae archaeon]
MKEVTTDLMEAGIGEGISEVIVTTRSASGKSNAAPVGIITEINDEEWEKKHFIRLYKGSQTLSNVLETNTLAANVTDDAVLFVKSAFEHLSQSYFSVFEGMPVLTEAQSWIVFASMLAEESNEYLLFRVTPKAVKIKRKRVKAINRGLNAVIEAAILATRLNRREEEEEKEDTKKQMEHYKEIVEKCGGRREKEAMDILNEKFFKENKSKEKT